MGMAPSMRKLAFAGAALVAFAAPAHATSSATCRATTDPEIRLDIVIGHLVGPVIAQARFGDGLVTTADGDGPMIAQSWLDERALHLDIVDPAGSGYVARLRTWRPSGSGAYAGSLRHAGRQYQVRCRIEEEN